MADEQKARCRTCGAEILQRTADAHGGRCKPCARPFGRFRLTSEDALDAAGCGLHLVWGGIVGAAFAGVAASLAMGLHPALTVLCVVAAACVGFIFGSIIWPYLKG